MEKRLKLLFLVRDQHGCGFYRMMVPANEIKRLDLADVMLQMQWDQQAVNWADVIITQRMTEPQAFEAIEQAQVFGKKVIYEIDDFLQSISPANPSFYFWSPLGPNIGRALRLIQKCDAVQVSTERLRNEYALWNPNIEVLPNYLDKTIWDNPAWTATHWDNYYQKKNDGIIRIGWAGADSHYHDLQLVEEILTKICNKYPNVHLCLFGYHGESKIGPYLFQKIALAETKCPNCKQGGQLERINGTELLYYPSKLKEAAFDIAIAPLIETGFNEGKSDLKVKEYAALGIPVVASNVPSYNKSVKHGYTGFLATTGKEWYDYLELLIVDKSLRFRLGENNHRWHQENTIDKHINKWLQFYSKVLGSRSRF